MVKLNCWEYTQCGREANGLKAEEFGVCPASIIEGADNINNGKNGGRSCWAIAGTMCNDKIQGTFAIKFNDCLKCEFYKEVQEEEEKNWKNSQFILEKIRHKVK